MRFFLAIVAILAAAAVIGGVWYWYGLSSVQEPLSYQEIKHKEDFEKLTHILLPTTRAVLERDGEVAQPIAFGIEMNDQLDFLNAEGNSTVDSLKLIIRDFKEGAHNGYYRSVAVAYDTTRHDPGQAPYDAIEFRFEHIDGEALRGWFPYRREGKRKFWYGQTHYVKAPLEVFTHHNLEWGD